MSVIAGLIRPQDNQSIPYLLDDMCDSLASNHLNDQSKWCQGYCGMAIRSSASQRSTASPPIALSSDNSIAATLVGNIVNRLELLNNLGLKSDGIDSFDNAALVVAAYQHYGDDFAQHLIGDFSFALWCFSTRRLHLVVSPFASSAFFFHWECPNFTFASMVQPLFAVPTIKKSLNVDRIVEVLSSYETIIGKTLFANINRVVPGCMITVDEKSITERKVWQPDLHYELKLKSDSEYTDAFNSLFDEVVKDEVGECGDIGIMLSSGLDSASVALSTAELLQQANRQLIAWTYAPEDDNPSCYMPYRCYDESNLVKDFCDQHNIPLSIVHLSSDCLFDGLNDFFGHAYVPFRNAMNRTWIESILSDAGSKGISRILTGGQGNLTISWKGDEYLASLFKKGELLQAFHEANLSAKQNGRNVVKYFVSEGIAPFTPGAWEMIQNLQSRLSGIEKPEFISALNPNYRSLPKSDCRKPQTSITNAAKSRQIRWNALQKSTAGSAVISSGYRSQFGVDMRDPTADMRIVTFCLSLPVDQFHKDGISRRLIRKAMKNRLPPAILDNRLRGLQAADWPVSVARSHSELTNRLNRLKNVELVHDLVDIDGLNRVIDKVKECIESRKPVPINLRNYLESGMMMGAFIEWFHNM